MGDRPVNNWHYAFVPAGDGTDVTESFRLSGGVFTAPYRMFFGQLRKRRNIRDMTKTLNRIKAEVEKA